MSRPERSRLRYLTEPFSSLFIFVPALMSVGFVFWFSALVRDQLRRRQAATIERRAETAGPSTAALVLGDERADDADANGLAERRLYVLAALPFLILGIYVFIGAIGNYLREDGYVSEIAWLLALSLLLSFGFASVATVLTMVSIQWPTLSPTLRWLAAHTPIGSLRRAPGTLREPSPGLVTALVATASATTLFSMVVGSSRGFLRRIDEPVLEAFSEAEWLGWVAAVDPLGKTAFAIAAAALLGIASFRCRPLVVAYPLAIVGGMITNNLLKVIVERDRPLGGAFGGKFDSFPSGHLVLMTVLVGLLPLTVAVMVHSRRFLPAMRAGAVIVLLGGSAHRIHDEAHWPTDVLGGVLIGFTLVLLVEWIVAHEAWHRRCASCIWAPEDRIVRAGAVPMRVDSARILSGVAHLLAGGAAIALTVLATTRGLPRDPDGALIDIALQRPIQMVLAGLVSFGAVISWRWVPVGAAMMALSASMLGMFAGLQYEPIYAVGITSMVLVPAVLLWLSWQHDRSVLEIVTLGLTTGGLAFAAWFGASMIFDATLGPTHEDSDAVLGPVDRVEWVWSGSLTAESIVVTARLDDDDASARLIVSNGQREWQTPIAEPDDAELIRFSVEGLEPDTAYTYTVEVDGELDEGRGHGSFRTPGDGPTSFRLVSSSCARTDSNAEVFDAILAEQPLLYLQLGDLHYSNINSSSREAFDTAFDRVLGQPGQAELYRNVPISYVWDDHDFGPNDADSSSPSRDVARAAFRDTVPSHPLASADGTIHRAFTIGRVRFIVTDTRSARTDTTMLGAEQLAWFEREIVESARDHALVIWMNPSPWIGTPRAGGDGWSGYAEERTRIADVIAGAEVDNLLMVSGDAHMLAFDDGTNSGYAADGGGGFPVFHAAALDRPGSVKGGPYTGGTFPGFGQYGVIDIADDGTSIEVHLVGKNWEGQVLIDETLTWGP